MTRDSPEYCLFFAKSSLMFSLVLWGLSMTGDLVMAYCTPFNFAMFLFITSGITTLLTVCCIDDLRKLNQQKKQYGTRS